MLTRENGFYPFLDASKNAVRAMGISGEVESRIIEMAKTRVLNAIKHKKIPPPTYLSSREQQDILDDIRSYAVARLLISMLGRKMEVFVEAESKRALELCIHNKHEKFLMKELGIELIEGNYIPLKQYLKFSSSFSSMMLSNREVKDGYVKVQDHELTTFLKEAIRSKISEGLPIKESLINEDIRNLLKPAVSDILSEISLLSPSFGRASKDIAPCVEKIIEELRTGANVSHIKRWTLAVFLTKRGWDEDRIVSVFSTAPNFNEKITRYQLQHIRSKGYSMPSCAHMKSQGLCVAECGIKNPLQYRKKSE